MTDAYQFENELADLYPDNQHIQAKIRQQLQVLRDEWVIKADLKDWAKSKMNLESMID